MKKTINPLWGGRFEKENSNLLKDFNNSISFDYQLGLQDVKVNKVYCEALKKAKILSEKDFKKIKNVLDEIQKDIKKNDFKFDGSFEDIQINIEMAVKKKIGNVAGKMHTGKSRNDQVATDLKLWIRENSNEIISRIKLIQKSLLKKAEQNIETILPGLTHFQNAQPISLAHYFLSFFEMFSRDKSRFENLIKNTNECPLGSGALAGTNFFEIDRKFIAKRLGFAKPTENSLDSVSDRDFAIEFLSSLSILSMHFSRIAEDFIIWSNVCFNFLSFSDSLSTGSSIMPQKKNPDAAELVRAKTGSIYASLFNLLIILKGLPSGYSKDLQEDKVPIFNSFNSVKTIMEVVNEMISSIVVVKEKMYEASMKGFITATDLADWMVKNIGINFREAHFKTGRIVLLAEKNKLNLHEMPLRLMQSIEPKLTERVFDILTPENSVLQKKSYGGTAFTEIRKAISRAKKKI